MDPILEVRLSIALDRERTLIFDVNTMRAYEKAMRTPENPQGRKYWDTILNLFEFHEKNQAELTPDLEGKRSTAQLIRMSLEMLRHISTDELATLLWAACHEYAGKKPVWPLTIDEVGSFLRPQDTPKILSIIIQGHAQNAPTRSELGEASGASQKGAEADPNQTGGQASIELPADVFASEKAA